MNFTVLAQDTLSIAETCSKVYTNFEPPILVPVSPLAGATDAEPDGPIIFDLYDESDTLDLDSVIVRVKSIIVWQNQSPQNGWSGVTRPIQGGAQYVLQPPDGFTYGETIDVRVVATDKDI